MRRQPTLRAVICDDDVVLRSVLASTLDSLGIRVVGEADSVASAIAVIEATHVDIIILDLALSAGSGEEVLAHLREAPAPPRAVVFSAFSDHPDELRRLGAAAVFEKPDFEGLEGWLAAQTEQPAFAPIDGPDRRRPPQPAPILPDRGPVAPSGIEAWATFRAAVDRLWPGDAIVAFDLIDLDRVATSGDALQRLDHRLALARSISPTLRDLDRLAVAPQGQVVALLVAGHPEAPSAVFDRLALAWDREGLPGTPKGAFAHVRSGNHPSVTLGTVLERIADPTTTAEHPLRLA